MRAWGWWGVRYLGLVGSVLLAGAAHGAGAVPGGAGSSGIRDGRLLAAAGYTAAVTAWLVGLVLLGVAWWRLGRLLRGAGGPGRRWLVGTGLLWALPPLLAPPLGSRDVYAYACQGWLWLAGGDPYGVGPAAGACPWADEVPALWRDAPSPYGPLAVAVSGLAVAGARALPGDDLLTVVGLLRLAALGGAALALRPGAWLARRCGVRPADAAWLGVVTPLGLLHAVSGAHHDALLAGLLVAACAAAFPRAAPGAAPGAPAAPRGDRPGGDGWLRRALGGGALLGLAAAVKITALVAAPFLLLVVAGAVPWGAARPAGGGAGRGAGPVDGAPVEGASAGPAGPGGGAPPAPPARPGGTAWLGRGAVVLAAAVGAFTALSLVTGLGLGWLGALTGTSALTQWTSLPTGVGMTLGYALHALGRPDAVDPAIAGARLVGLAVLAAGVATLWWRAARRPEHPAGAVAAAGWALLAAALLAPVVYPWYLFAPLALLAVAAPAVRARRWLAAGGLGATVLVFPDGLGLAVLTKGPGALLVTAVVGVIGWRLLARGARRRRAGRLTGSGPPGPAR